MLLFVAGFLAALAVSNVRSSDYYNDRDFFRTQSGLTEVPGDIPADAVKVVVSNNAITRVRSNVFSHLTACLHLDLSSNAIETIESDAFTGLGNLKQLYLLDNSLSDLSPRMFQALNRLEVLYLSNNSLTELKFNTFPGLRSLETLYLHWNNINNIQDGVFSDLGELRILRLDHNEITELQSDIFHGLSNLRSLRIDHNRLTTIAHRLHYPDRPLTLAVSDPGSSADQPLECDSRLCWLKAMEDGGIITWHVGPNGRMYKPDCAHGIDWFTLSCSSQSICNEPGYVGNATYRSVSGWPYRVNSQIRYSCMRCSTGGGTITCQSNGQWTPRSVDCTAIACPRPTSVPFGSVQPSAGPYTCRSTVTYYCDSGYTLVGNKSLTCIHPGQWNSLAPSCQPSAICNEPGHLVNAHKSGSGWPYRVDSQVQYSCKPCNTGGGTLTCQSNGQWTPRSVVCTAIACPRPASVPFGSVQPSAGPYTCGSTVTYYCNSGYTLVGNKSLTCRDPGQWNSVAPSCQPSGNYTTATAVFYQEATKSDKNNNDALIIALSVIVSLVVGIIITCVIVYICLKRRGIKIGLHMREREGENVGAAGGAVNPTLATRGNGQANLYVGNDEMQMHPTDKVGVHGI